jgi:pimeloyl-ACP methyl ester carboxylesterase
MATFLVAHGAWTGGWFWRKMFRPMRELGHELIVPTLTGLGERQHLGHQGIDLDTHVSDLLHVMHCEDLAGVTLIGHSYGGMVATGVAHKAAQRLDGVIYLDAFVPQSGECLLDLLPAEARSKMEQAAGAQVPPNPMPPDTMAEDVAWAVARRVPQPLRTFEQPVVLGGVPAGLAKAYIYCSRHAPGDVFGRFSEQARNDADWIHAELDSSHNPHVTAPAALATLLDTLVLQLARRRAIGPPCYALANQTPMLTEQDVIDQYTSSGGGT